MKSYEEMTEEELITVLRDGDSKVYDYLLEKYKNLVRKKAREMFLVGGETDDLIQEGMIGLFKAIRDYDPKNAASFQTFARLCIDRQLYKAVQSSLRQKHQPLNGYLSFSSEEGEELPMPDHDNPEQILINRESVEGLRRRIDSSLSRLENQVLALYLEGESYDRIAQEIGKTPKSVDNTLRRVREKIKNM